MKKHFSSYTLFTLALNASIMFVNGEDDGKYKPEKYGSEQGKYQSNIHQKIPLINQKYYKDPYVLNKHFAATEKNSLFPYTAYQNPDTAKFREADRNARVIALANSNNKDNYHYSYLTDNGIDVEETGTAGDPYGTRAIGHYEYVGDDGVKYRVDYTADENGFQAYGAHLPTPPPIPDAIAKSLRQRGLLA